ncbi:hypothetical protein J6590_048935 [Homalodisca vitripennis]|nr:hypothetical protein J6590_048935 [Homalodisca vitripennis]
MVSISSRSHADHRYCGMWRRSVSTANSPVIQNLHIAQCRVTLPRSEVVVAFTLRPLADTGSGVGKSKDVLKAVHLRPRLVLQDFKEVASLKQQYNEFPTDYMTATLPRTVVGIKYSHLSNAYHEE